MNTGKHKLKAFLTHHDLDQIVIPEIQRDYVWKEENVTKLLESIKLNADRQNSSLENITDEQLNQLSPEVRDIVIRGLEDKKQYCNMGFIYAYSDSELAGRFVLIDGQQRMTTLYLLLLNLCVKEGKIDHFKRSYFQDGIPKFDYKVREEAHDFLVNFISHILEGNSIDSTKDQHWYYEIYENDSTIYSLWNNYKIIDSFLDENVLSLEYVEDYIEFWYFDTNKSKQGEELYIYMNSRGESVSSNESIKANLLKGLSDQEKHDWGVKWEKWQDLFWKNKVENISADKGFEEFLKWIKIIEFIKGSLKKNLPTVSQITWLRTFKDVKRISGESLTLQIIESNFNALSTIIKYKDELKYKSEWLKGQTEAIEYIRLLPMILFAEKYPDCSAIEIKRFSRFFFNVTRFDIISKNPYPTLINVINLTISFLNSNFRDVTELINLVSNKSYENILTSEETIKLKLYKDQIDSEERIKIEGAFWGAEDYKFCEGKISFLWDYIDFQPTLENINGFDLEEFKQCLSNFKSLFNSADDLLRRALLSKGDYPAYDGRTSSLDGDRYSFIIEDWRWKTQFPNKNKAPFYKDLVTDFSLRKSQTINLSREQILSQIISGYLTTNTELDWKHIIISNPDHLEYCRQKFICFSGDKIHLLQDRNAAQHNWKTIN